MSIRDHIKFNISFPTILLSEQQIHEYVETLAHYGPRIRDINIAARILPFTIDGHGIEMDDSMNRLFLNQMEYIQAKSHIPVSLTLNNIYVPNDETSFNLFVENYRPYYEKGFTHLTLPHITWLDYGFKDIFPDTDVKITTIRKIYTAQDFWNYAYSGFDLVNVDRRLQRNHTELKQIRAAQINAEKKFGRRTEISIICNESCVGTCRYFDEHYAYMMNKSNPTKMTERLMPHYTCMEYPDYSLRRFNVLGLKHNIDALCEYIDVVKLAGRRAEASLLMKPFEFIDWFLDEKIEHSAVLAPIYFRNKTEEVELVKAWSNTIKTCKYECCNCGICDHLEKILSRYYKWLPDRGNK